MTAELNPLEARAWLCLDGWAGRSETEVQVVGETPTRWRITPLGKEALRLGGRRRYVEVGMTVLVPKRAVRFGDPNPRFTKR